jgi:methyl-accepting chemotaxis protein
MTNNELYADWQARAEAGDGSFAIALALLNLTTAVKWLGTGNAATPMGAIEFLATHIGEKIESLASSTLHVSTSLDRVAEAMPTTEGICDKLEGVADSVEDAANSAGRLAAPRPL